jgi:sulfotransferase family protein
VSLLAHLTRDAADRILAAITSRAARIRGQIVDAHTVGLSFPKAGRSWVCYFLARYVAERTGGPLDLNVLADGRELPPLCFLHEHIDVFEDEPAPARLLNEELLMRRRIVVLARDPRDTLVSYWHQKRVREGRPVSDRLDLFADCPVYGIERISQSTVLLLDLYEHHPGDKLLVTYEGLISHPERRLPEVLRFSLDGRPLDDQACRNALEASRFENMREWERGLSAAEARTRYEGRFGRRRDGALGDAHFKVRRGKVGGFETEMSPELQSYVIGLPHTAELLERLAGLIPRPAGARYDQLQVSAPVART